MMAWNAAGDVADELVVLVHCQHPELPVDGLGPVPEPGEIRTVLPAAASPSAQVAPIAGMVGAGDGAVRLERCIGLHRQSARVTLDLLPIRIGGQDPELAVDRAPHSPSCRTAKCPPSSSGAFVDVI